MNLNPFLSSIRITTDIGNGEIDPHISGQVDDEYTECVKMLGGKTFGGGIYRVYRGDQVAGATAAMQEFFPEVKSRITVFAYDWLGRHFAVDRGRIESGNPMVLMLEVGTGEILQIPSDILQFHNNELVYYCEEALAGSFYSKWKSLRKDEILPCNCVGYKVPLFLGGSDNLDNLELIDLSVYVQICSQLRNKTRELPSGSTIIELSIENEP